MSSAFELSSATYSCTAHLGSLTQTIVSVSQWRHLPLARSGTERDVAQLSPVSDDGFRETGDCAIPHPAYLCNSKGR